MFRPIRRINKEIGTEDAKKLLASSRRGVLAVNGDNGYPYAIPVNYLYNEEEHTIIFHGAKSGHKAESIKACDKVCFTVFGNETIREEEWAPYVQSVVAFGRCHLIENREKTMQLLRLLAKKYYPDNDLIEEEVKKSGAAAQIFEIIIEHMSGKEIQER